jgi:hypothetical protein
LQASQQSCKSNVVLVNTVLLLLHLVFMSEVLHNDESWFGCQVCWNDTVLYCGLIHGRGKRINSYLIPTQSPTEWVLVALSQKMKSLGVKVTLMAPTSWSSVQVMNQWNCTFPLLMPSLHAEKFHLLVVGLKQRIPVYLTQAANAPVWQIMYPRKWFLVTIKQKLLFAVRCVHCIQYREKHFLVSCISCQGNNSDCVVYFRQTIQHQL